MQEFLVPYTAAFAGLLALAALMVIQFAVADIAGIRAKQVPGMPVSGGHDSFLFRATRAHANTIENIGLQLLLAFTCVLIGANPGWTIIWIWLFVAARAAHMAFYYADWRNPRSAAFTVGAVAQIGLLVTGFLAL